MLRGARKGAGRQEVRRGTMGVRQTLGERSELDSCPELGAPAAFEGTAPSTQGTDGGHSNLG